MTSESHPTHASGRAQPYDDNHRSTRTALVPWVRERTWPLVVWGAMLAWFAALFFTVRSEFVEFRLARFDLGNMTQAVWSTAHGRPLEVTDTTGEQVVRLAGHVDPILVLLAPVWIVFPTPLMLAAVQIAACALGALPVFWLARRHLGSEQVAGLLAFAYLAYPWLAWTALDAFHPVTLAIPLFLFAIWFLDSGRLWAFAACAVLILATGELMGLSLAALGLWYWRARGQRRAGLAIFAAGCAWTLACLALIVPAFRGEENRFYERFESVGGSPSGLIRTAFADPGAIVAALTSIDDLLYLFALGIPLVGAFLLAPRLALVASPQLLVNALSDFSPTTSPRTHYIAAVVPFLIAGTVLGLARISPRGRHRVAVLVLGVSATLGVALAPWDAVAGRDVVGFHTDLPPEHVAALREAVALVPSSARVSTTNRAGSHLSERRYVYGIDVTGDATWIVLDTWDARVGEAGWQPARFRVLWQRIEQDPSWLKVYERDGVLVFERVGRG